MTQQPTEAAVGGEAETPAAETPQEYFEQLAVEEFGPDPEEEQPEGELEETEDEPEIEEEADDLPPIDPPVSWDADAKAKFAELPRELQETVTKREVERERFVQQKSQEAARAKQEVEQQAYQSLAQYEQQVSAQLQQYAQLLSVPEPDMSLLATDPHTYALQAKRYQDAQAQRNQAQQQAQMFAQQAQEREQQAEQAYLAQQHQIIVENFPEYADPTTGPKIQQELSAVARELGYPPELISQARAQDIIAMRKVAELKAKADKYDALNSQKMAKVRAAKGLPPVAKPGVSQGGDQRRVNRAQAAFETAKTSKNRQVQGDAFYEYLKNTGQV